MTTWRITKTHQRLGLVSVLRRLAKTPESNSLRHIDTSSTDMKHPAEPTDSMNDATTIDLRGVPTLACICGSLMFNITVMWDEETRAVGWYDLKQQCHTCGAISTAPTEIDGCD